jgi:hypothetical protein
VAKLAPSSRGSNFTIVGQIRPQSISDSTPCISGHFQMGRDRFARPSFSLALFQCWPCCRVSGVAKPCRPFPRSGTTYSSAPPTRRRLVLVFSCELIRNCNRSRKAGPSIRRSHYKFGRRAGSQTRICSFGRRRVVRLHYPPIWNSRRESNPDLFVRTEASSCLRPREPTECGGDAEN